jgi:hypothetical protein
VAKRIFSYEEAIELMPEVQRITEESAERIESLPDGDPAEHERVVTKWAEDIMELGLEVKGLWLVDFDTGGGYYCWRYPEPALEYFHGYDEGFAGRVKLN